MNPQTTVKVVIQGIELSFKTDDPEYIRTLAEFVDKQIEKITASDKVASHPKAVTLAAFSIADELFRLRKEKSLMSEEISQRLGAMLEMAEETYRSTRPSLDRG